MHFTKRIIWLTLVLTLSGALFQQVFAQQAFEGKASWYGPNFAGRTTANGEVYDPSQLTAAHKTLEFGTLLRVTNLANGLSVDVRVNDRGPYIHGRVIDLSQAAAAKIGMELAGVGNIRAEFISEIGEADLDFPATATYNIERDSTLSAYEVAHTDYSEGTLLLAFASGLDEPLLVRAVAIKENDSDKLLVSESLFTKIGEELEIYQEAASKD